MKVEWYVLYIMKQIKNNYARALIAKKENHLSARDFEVGQAFGAANALYCALLMTDKHLASLFDRWHAKQLAQFHKRESV